ncbi:MAG TPA: ABC transporter ATP-binding protein, partial [Armatimonadaceae bacterium]|nr:ABC transporter ATP-binding protein [Armatimonadaceae bacterium]
LGGLDRSVGGLSRSYGLQNRDVGGDPNAPPVAIERALLTRAARLLLLPHWRAWLVVFACIAATAALGVLPPLAVRGILDQAIPQGDSRLLLLLVGAIVGLTVVAGFVGLLQNFVSARVGEAIVYDLRQRLFAHLQSMSLPYYTRTRAGETLSRVTSDVGAVQGAAAGTLISIASNLCTVIATAAVIFAMDWRLALLALAVVPTLYLPTRAVGRFRRRLSRETQEAQADQTAFLQERLNIGGMLLTKTFVQAGTDARTFGQLARRVMNLNIRQALAGRWLSLCLNVISVAGPALIYAYGGYLAIRGQITVGTIIAFVAYLSSLYRPLANLANVYVDVQGALAILERIFGLLDTEPEVRDRPGAVVLSEPVRGHIRFEEVGFAYPAASATATAKEGQEEETGDAAEKEPEQEEGSEGRDPFALRDLSFEILPGQRVALVGPSGAGKTTVTYLLPRLLDPSEGRITLDGHDLRDLTQESLRTHIGVVTQETFLFHATVRDNLLYARPDATEEQMIAAARAANVHEFLSELPDGYDTVVGERAFRLSGGERQRLSIARALLKDPRILVLDEATSSLDATSEYLIQQALETLLAGRTSLIIAHRLSTVRNADRILVLEKGRLVESGRHEELLERGGLYATLYRRQFGRERREATLAEAAA